MREERLNLTPLLDVIFILIFFFLLATTLREQKERLEINLPKSSQKGATTPQQEMIFIQVTRENEIFFEDAKVTVEELTERLRSQTEGKKGTEVVLRGDAKAYTQTIVDVLDACADAGLKSVTIDVKRKE